MRAVADRATTEWSALAGAQVRKLRESADFRRNRSLKLVERTVAAETMGRSDAILADWDIKGGTVTADSKLVGLAK